MGAYVVVYFPCFLGGMLSSYMSFICFFFFNDTATTEIYTLSLHDALPICGGREPRCWPSCAPGPPSSDRKSTRLNSSHITISYAVFCLKKKKKKPNNVKLKIKTKKKTKKKNK